MAPIDYSKWDNIDTDSDMDSDPGAGSRPQPPASTTTPTAPAPAPAPAPATTTSTSAPSSSNSTVQAVTVRCQGEQRRGSPWTATTIPADHPVFNNTVPPVPALLDFPIVIHRVGTRNTGAFGYMDNQPITYLNVDATSGLAPPQWQSGIGTVIVARKDKKDLSPEHYEAIWMYLDHILDYFGEGPAPTRLYNRQAFERWFEGYKRENAGFGRAEWRSVAPLY